MSWSDSDSAERGDEEKHLRDCAKELGAFDIAVVVIPLSMAWIGSKR